MVAARITAIDREAERLLIAARASTIIAQTGLHGTGASLTAWVRAQPWPAKHQRQALKQALKLLHCQNTYDAEAMRQEIIRRVTVLLPQCEELKIGTAGRAEGGGSVILKDPRTGEYLREINHSAVAAYLRILIDLCGLDQARRKLPNEDNILAHKTDEELEAMAAAGEAKPSGSLLLPQPKKGA
jgi:hypothetical protein